MSGAPLTLDFGRNISHGYSTRGIVLSGRWYLGVYFYKTQKGCISVMSPLRHMPGGSYQKTGLREGGVCNFLFQQLSPPMLIKVLRNTLLSPIHSPQCCQSNLLKIQIRSRLSSALNFHWSHCPWGKSSDTYHCPKPPVGWLVPTSGPSPSC